MVLDRLVNIFGTYGHRVQRAAPDVPAVRMTRRELLLSLIGFALLAAVLALAYQAYFSPSMLVDLSNLRLCI